MSDGGLEKLEKRLYKKGETFEGRFREPEFTYPPADEGSETVLTDERKPASRGPEESDGRRKLSWDMRTLIGGIVIFFAGAIVLAAVYLFSGFGTVSGRNIEIAITAPETVAGGELVRWEVAIRNKNDVALENVGLSFQYPAGSRPATEGLARAGIPVERRTLGGVAAGETRRETFSAFVYGGEGFEGEAKAALEYRLSGSNAIFEKSEIVKIIIERSPVGVSVATSAEVNAGRPTEIEVRYVSNAETVLHDLTLELVYPEGFTLTSASPEPAEGITRWRIGDLARGEERRV